MMIDCIGEVTVILTSENGERVINHKNIVVKAGREVMCRFLLRQNNPNGSSPVGVEYLALGTGTTTPTENDTALANETLRKAITQTTLELGNTARFTTYFPPTEANNVNFKELGLFGNGATSSSGSGTLFARALTDFTKTNQEAMTIVWKIQLKVV